MPDVAQRTGLYDLPNELLLHILTPFPTLDLLALTTLSHRIHALILRILHNRLLLAANLHDHTLLLECYHPSAKLTEPPLFCTYLGTPGLDDVPEACLSPGSSNEGLGGGGGGSSSSSNGPLTTPLATMRSLYSTFRPHHRSPALSTRRHPAGDIPGSRTHPSSSASQARHRKTGDGSSAEELVRQLVSLDSHELFTQLCAQIHLVRVGPRNGLFRCFVEVEEGVVRVWRGWLGERACAGGKEMLGAKGKQRDDGVVEVRVEKEGILWVKPGENVGLRFRVRERVFRREGPVLLRMDEEVAVTYEIEYEELLVRTSHLLLSLEKSLIQMDNTSGKAVVFGSFG
ncbi:hypothetical protein W97_07473 [Coniosporium apollinis CBS 100218]|uniref:F-box domain-containing protein n=1 Tax=Coniosporium apollinis (strain CBS 100218) TaxID=1168221 RepID=R7Z1Z6_CONA1|nr:uncharacterized protein W97_07473 [Coniosporium apollinis CBS 100218]EON68215.1 hypothetical protein W97_07473 [Coniosporium apollinis CBS 100218]